MAAPRFGPVPFVAALLSVSACEGRAAAPPPAPTPAAPSTASSAPTPVPETRRVAIRAAAALAGAPEIERLKGWSRRQGVRIEAAGEDTPVPAGWEAVRLGVVPVSPEMARRLVRFGIRADSSGFVFDGRTYRAAEDAVAVRDPSAPAETLVAGNSKAAVVRLAARRVFRFDGAASDDYMVVSGELSKRGRFTASGASLAVDRRSDRDEIGARDEFVRSLSAVERNGVRWLFSDRDRAAVARLEPVLARYLRRGRAAPLTVRIFPDPAMKAHLTGSSRPADLAREENGVRVDVDASAPPAPDLVSGVLAAAAFASEEPRLLERPALLLALGARAAGRFWGREVAGFASFARRAGVEPSVEEALGTADDVSPLVAVGTAAAWLEAGYRREGERAVLAALTGPDAPLVAALRRWRAEAERAPFSAPPRRTAPSGFLRGVSYAMSNSVEAGYASPKSHETLGRLARLGANSVSIMPFAFQRDAELPALAFVHRNPQGETDEGTLHAVSDARAYGMTAMVKPQIWVGHEDFVGRIAMKTEADWARWFALYRRFIVHQALVSEASGAAFFCVGTELAGTESRVREWRELIAAVRLATGASLTYAANWTGGAMKVPFWDALDVIGVDFYDPLAAGAGATDAELEAGARAAARPLEALAKRLGRPVVFTEAGYPLARAAWMTPHDENTGRPASGADAARAIAALYRALEKEAWWKGVYWWKAFSSGREARDDERGFNVLGGAPERAVADGFERLARERGK